MGGIDHLFEAPVEGIAGTVDDVGDACRAASDRAVPPHHRSGEAFAGRCRRGREDVEDDRP